MKRNGEKNRCEIVNRHYTKLALSCLQHTFILLGISGFLYFTLHPLKGAGIATGYGLDDRGVGVRVPIRAKFSYPHVVKTGSGAHPTSYPMGTEGSFSGGKVAGA
jgi:hypothetical protein